MNRNEIYLKSLLQDAALAGLLSHSPEISSDEAILLNTAGKLAGAAESKQNFSAVKSMFSYLPIDGQTGKTRYFPQKPLDIKSFFPVNQIEHKLDSLREQFNTEYAQIASGCETAVRAETFLHLLHKYATAWPSPVAEELSLYDFAKSKAAIAVCLSGNEGISDTGSPFLMIGGDMNGIQDFIFSIVSTNAAKNLKGRSYYLHLLADTILHRILQDAGLFQANVVYASGGAFFVLAPNTQEIKRLLASIEQEVSRQLFSIWGTGLSVSLVYTEMGTDQLDGKSVNEVWSNIHEAFSLCKRERLNRLVLERYGDIFEAQENGGETRRDVISQIEISPGETVFKIEGAIPTPAVQSDYDDPEAKLVSGPTREQIMLGFFMKSEMYRATGTSVLSFSFGNDFDESRKIVPAQIGIRHFILNKGEHVRRIGSVSQQILKVNDTNFMSVEASGKAVRGFELYGGNQYPESIYQYRTGDQAPKTFSEMAGAKDEDRAKESSNYNQEFGEVAFKRLGILRMDVDGLGSVFRHFKGSMAHFSALSRQLDWFFKGYLNTLWEEGQIEVKDRNGEKQPFPFREWTQIIYSGGDDLFLVGKWDCLLELAQQIELKFREWVCGHPGLGISGGIVFTTHKFPVIKAARQCDDFEKLAKRHKFTDKAGKIVWQKNSLMVFDHPLHWEHELPIVAKLKNELLRYVELDILPRGFIIGLQTFHQLKVVQEQSNDTSTWRWQLAYQIARLQNRLHKRPGKDDSGEQVNELFVFLKELKTNIFADRYEGESLASKTNYHFFDLLSIAARWSEYELRTILDKKSTNNTLSI